MFQGLMTVTQLVIYWMFIMQISIKIYDLFNFRSLNKQIKDKKEHRDKLAEDMKRDAEKQVQLEKKIEVNLKFRR